MKYNSDPIFEAYSNHRKRFILEQSVAAFYASDPIQQIHDLYQYDLACIEELVTEGALGDVLGKVKGGVSKATSYLANKGIQLLLSLVKKTATPEELEEIKKLEDPEKLKELAKKGMATLNKEEDSKNTVTNNEGVYLNKRFFASTILTESNIEKMLEKYVFVNEQILSEVTAGYRKAGEESPFWATTSQAKKQKKEVTRRKRREVALKNLELAKLAKVVAYGLKKKYDNRQINRFLLALDDEVSKRSVSSGENSLTTRTPEEPKSLGYKGSGNELSKDLEIETEQIPSETSSVESPRLPSTEVSAPATKKKEGIIRKAINWVKANPKRTAGTLVGIIAAIGVAVGGPAVLIPMLAKAGLGSVASGAITGAVTGAGLGAAKNIASQGFSNKKFSGKELGKAALKGGALGAVGGAVKGMFGGVDDQGDDEYLNDKDRGETVQYKQEDEGDTAEGGDVGTVDVSATPDDFQKYNGEPIDPKSWRDKIKMDALNKLKSDGNGQIDSGKYNNFVKKLMSMGKAAKGKSVESIMGESYTVHYLSLLR